MPEGAWADRVLGWARRQGRGVLGTVVVALRTVRACIEDRVTGLAAEMAFFALLSIIPLLIAVGAVLGLLSNIVGPDAVARGQAAAITALSLVFTNDVVDAGLGPLVEGLLGAPRGGIALSSLLIALYLSSRVFAAVIRALDTAYGTVDRRNPIVARLLAIGFALGAVVLVSIGLLVLVVGPLLGVGQRLAASMGVESIAVQMWRIGRFPAFVLVTVLGVALCYRVAPNRTSTWREVLPGSVVAVAFFAALSTGLRIYLQAGGSLIGAGPTNPDAAVGALLALMGAVVAVVVWVWLSGMALLIGGELNAEIERHRSQRGQPMSQVHDAA